MKYLRRLLAILVVVVTCMVTASASTVSYTYDDKGRLWKVSYASGEVIEYTYDAAGNRVAKKVTGAANTGPSAASGGVVVLPISGFIVLPIGDPDCTVLSGCK